jgi:hypothetical protein
MSSRASRIPEWSIVLGVILIAAAYYYTTMSIAGDSSDDSSTDDSSTGDSSTGTEGGILAALSNFENTASIHNNPGAICGGYDSSGNCTGPKTFPTLDAGIASGEALVNKFIAANPLITVAQFVKKWSGSSGAVLNNYTNSVSNDLGLDPNDPITDADTTGDGTDGSY